MIRLRNRFLAFAVFLGILVALSCTADTQKKKGDEDLLTALLPLLQRPDCEKNSTGTIYFENRSSNHTYDIIWDGSRWETLEPGERSRTHTVAAGSHTLVFRLSNSQTQACTPSTPVIAVCSNVYYYCSG